MDGTRDNIKWYKRITFLVLLALTLIPIWDLLSIVLVMNTKGKDLVVEESSRLIEQLGNNAISEIGKRSQEIEALARSMATMGATLPRDVGLFKKVLPRVVDFNGDQAVAGGGIWPEPFVFTPGVEKRSFFYGRSDSGGLDYFDDYNTGRGYIHDEWYPVVKYSKPGACFWSKSYMDPYSYQPMVTCTVAMRDGQEFIGVSTVDLRLEGMAAFMEGIRVKTGGYVFLMDRNNKFLTFPDEKKVKIFNTDDKGKKTEEFMTAEQFAAKETLFAPIAAEVKSMNDDILARAKKMPNYRAETIGFIDADSDQINAEEAEFIAAVIADPLGEQTKTSGLYKRFEVDDDFLTHEPSLVFIFHVPGSYWKLIAVKPIAEAQAVAAAISRVIVGIVTISIFFGILIAAFILHHLLVKPIRTTTTAVQAIGDIVARRDFAHLGEFRIPIRADDELGRLGGVINELSMALEDSYGSLVELNANLERKVDERTRELQATLEEVRELKFSQDGDYYLTSLLVKPLSGNHARSETVNVDYVVRQKKKFQFKKYNEEIGGDMCVAHSIRLQERSYTVFLNADAMGKSIQGAGGVLVLGAIFEANIARTRLSSEVQRQTPERWLKNSFTDFQKVFESFDGSMLISLVLGLVDDDTGTVYFMNAEHPRPVLFRGGRAAFLGEYVLRKIGFVGQGEVNIEVHSLQPGDVLFIGSDGKDDLLMGTDAASRRIINEDETLFLRIVERGAGDLRVIFDHVLGAGELADDFSVMRIGYLEEGLPTGENGSAVREEIARARDLIQSGDYPGARTLLEEANQKDPHHPVILKNLIKVLGKLKQYEDATRLSEQYLPLRPGDTDLLIAAAFCAFKAGRLDDAVEWGEQVRLRRPNDEKNLKLLENLYRTLGNADRVHILKKEQEKLTGQG